MDIHANIRAIMGVEYMYNLPYPCNKARTELGVLFRELGYVKGAEIGVWRGRFTEVLCRANPRLHMICVDPWGQNKTLTSHDMPRAYRHAMARLPNYNTTIMRTTSQEAEKEIVDESLDFVYIDALHDFDNVMKDILAWVPKVRKGGMVSGHDYTAWYNHGVVHAVDAYTRGHDIKEWYVTSDWPPSYLWVK